MSLDSAWLLDFRENVYSQAGEDGVLREVLGRVPDRDRWCVEFGAWDGIFLSNTRALIERDQYAAVLIEGSPKRFSSLKSNYAGTTKIIPIHAFVGLTSSDGLDAILSGTPIPTNFDFLSIDVDGNDYHIWDATQKYAPKVVCIEFNPTIPTQVRFVQPADPRVRQGSSLLSIVELGRSKGYELISVLPHNAILVRAEYYPLFEIADNAPAILRKTDRHVTYLFTGYDGTVFVRGSRRLPWHSVEIRESALQQLPRILRRGPGDYSAGHKMLLAVHQLAVSPSRTIQRVANLLLRKFGAGRGPHRGA